MGLCLISASQVGRGARLYAATVWPQGAAPAWTRRLLRAGAGDQVLETLGEPPLGRLTFDTLLLPSWVPGMGLKLLWRRRSSRRDFLQPL